MGMLQGKVQGDTFIVVDTFALPVEGTETRVNAQEQAYEFLVAYPETAKVRRAEMGSCGAGGRPQRAPLAGQSHVQRRVTRQGTAEL